MKEVSNVSLVVMHSNMNNKMDSNKRVPHKHMAFTKRTHTHLHLTDTHTLHIHTYR